MPIIKLMRRYNTDRYVQQLSCPMRSRFVSCWVVFYSISSLLNYNISDSEDLLFLASRRRRRRRDRRLDDKQTPEQPLKIRPDRQPAATHTM